MNKIIIGIIFAFLSTTLQSQLVIDDGHFFSGSEIAELSNKMLKIENETSVQLLIFTTLDLNGKSPIDYGKDLGNIYRVGNQGINNGILILLSKNDRKVQILNGYGIEWIIPDVEAQKIIDQMIPFFKQQDFYGGVNKALTLIKNDISETNWTIIETRLNKISESDLGKIVKFQYTNESGKINYKYAIETDSQFANDFQIKLESYGTEFKLFYSKNMNDFASSILTKNDIIIYARLTDWKTKRLELLGIE